MGLIDIGFGNLVSRERIVAVVGPDAAPVKRLVREARERGFVMDSDHVVLSALPTGRFAPGTGPGDGDGDGRSGET